MNIVVIENKHFEREWLVKILERAFPNSVINEFRNAGDFLLVVGMLMAVDIIITEHHLPLCEAKPDIEEFVEKLRSSFPEAVANWNHQEAAERIVRHMKKNNINIPVVIYTHSQEEWIDPDVLQDSKVVYCEKRAEMKNILSCVRQILSIPA